MDLSAFLLARIAEDEEWAASAWAEQSHAGGCDTCGASFTRLLAKSETERAVVEAAVGPLQEVAWIASDSDLTDTGDTDAPARLLRLLAQPYADHTDYDPTWRP